MPTVQNDDRSPEPPLSLTSSPVPRGAVWALAIAAMLLWFVTLATRALVSADEGRYATLSLSMLQTGDWVTPRLNGLLYFEKPPLQYWAGALSMALLGANEFAARLWPGLCGLFTVAMLVFTAHRLWGQRTAIHTACVASSTTWMAVNSHFLSLDASLCAALTVVLCAVLLAQEALQRGQSARAWMLAAWAGMALAVLSKGLVGVVIPGAVLVIHSLWRLDARLWTHLQWVAGPVVFLVLTAPWFLAVSERNPDFAHFFFIHEHLDRYLQPGHRREGAPWYFVPYLLVGLLPWTSALPWVLRPRRSDFAHSWLWTWAVFIFVFFSLSSSKLPSYILPLFPALALLVARQTAAASPQVLQRHLWLPAGLWLVILVALPWALQRTPADIPAAAVESLGWGLALGGAGVVLAAVGAWRLLQRARITRAMILLAAAHLAATLMVLSAHNEYGQLKSSQRMVESLRKQGWLDPGPGAAPAPFFAVQAYDQTLPFYLGRPVILVDYRDEFSFGQAQEPERWMDSLDSFVQRWSAQPRALAYTSLETLEVLQRRGVALKVVWQDPRRVVVVKP